VLAKNQADAVAAKKALQSGQSWNEVAKKYSTDPTSKNNGGLLTGITKQQADPALANAAFSAPVNQLLGPVKGQFGYYVFDVNKVTPATHQSLAQASPLIKQQLTTQQQQTAQTAITTQAKKDWLSQTTCRSGYAMADCKGYTAPKTSTTTGTGSATATTG
jgi:foldase protein PrsA